MSSKGLELFDLSGKVAIVTGAASGIGRAIALKLADFGADIVLVDIAEENMKKVANEINSIGRKVLPVKASVTNNNEIKKMVEDVLNKFEKITILVNCAGILSRTPIVNLTEEEIDKILALNFKGMVFCSQAVMEHMIDSEYGKIVNIGSSISSRGAVCNISGGGAIYCASKAAVQSFTRCLAWELSEDGINVNAVAPGPAITPMHEGYIDQAKDYYSASIPAGRLAEPEDIANVVLFLVSEAAKYVIGQTIHVNGGQIMVD
ncbi:MAG: glucose 1-dehydrogenase [Candidatus Helarchaeota archaeon]|nr:glucose 1-dehydrogenase [Candidatus Helarchaeota archaeon]